MDALIRMGMEAKAVHSSLARIEGGFNALGTRVKGLGRDLASLAFSKVTLDMATAAVQAAELMRGFQGMMTQSMGSAQMAYDEILALQELARLPGLDFESAVKGSSRLQSLGQSALRSRDILKELSNVAALDGMGSGDFSEMIDALVDMGSAGSIADEKLDRLTERSATLSKVLKDTFGASTAEGLRNLGVGVNEFLTKLPSGLAELNRAGSGVTNEIKNMKDEVFQLSAEFGEFLIPAVHSGLKGITEGAESVKHNFAGIVNLSGAVSAWFAGMDFSDALKTSRGISIEARKQAEAAKEAHERKLKMLDDAALEEAKAKDLVLAEEARLERMKKQSEELKAHLRDARQIWDLQDDIHILEAKVQGNDRLAEQLERQAKLKEGLRAMENSSVGTESERLELLKKQYDLEEQLKKKEKEDGDKRDLAILEHELKVLEARASGNEALAQQLERQLKLGKEVYDLSKNSLLTDSARLDAAKKRLELEERIDRLNKFKADKEEWTIMQEELKILATRVSGNEELANLMERQLNTAKDLKSLADNTAATEAQKTQYVRERAALEEKLLKDNKALNEFRDDAEIARLRSRGRNRQADRIEFDRKVQSEVDKLAETSTVDRAQIEKEVREKIRNEASIGDGRIKGARQSDRDPKLNNPFRNLDDYEESSKGLSEYDKMKKRDSAWKILQDKKNNPQGPQAAQNGAEKPVSSDPQVNLLTSIDTHLKTVAEAAK